MTFATGDRIGVYEISGTLGAGGMGEVYRAMDRNLGRQVALKVLPESVAADPDRLARFEREAKTLAALNHPHVAQIYGLERSGTTPALVMELVEGETLADRIARGPIPIDEALPIAKQIAEALEAAHEQGIIHRDLKPANIKVRSDGTVKVLDFGLAKLAESTASATANATAMSMSPTITSPALVSGVGVLLGTAAYMSPEQARGKDVGKRSDIWAFGCVLYEMVTGLRAFEDEDVSMTLSKVLQREPDFNALPGDVPARVRQVLRVCLRKDPKQRAADMHDVRLALEGAFETAAPQITQSAAIARPLWQRALPVAAAAIGAVLLSGFAAWRLWPTAEPQVSRFEYSLPTGLQFRSTGRALVAFSRDGRRFVYNAGRGLYLRALNELEAHVIPGTEANLTSPFFSPDGQSVGYWQQGQLMRIGVSGGAPVVIGPAEDNPFGVSWETDDTILFGQANGIMRVAASGGTPELVIPAKEGEQVHGPQLLPDGDSVLFSATTVSGASRWDGAQVVVQSLRSSQREVVLRGGSDARYVPTGHLIYALKDGLFAVPFDAGRRRVTGGAVPVAQNIRRAPAPGVNSAAANYGVSDQGTLVYVKSTQDVSQGTLTWVARDGRETPFSTIAVEQPRNPRFAPDGGRLALIVADDLWVYDVAGRPPIKLTSNGGSSSPLWTPDGQRLVYDGSTQQASNVLVLPADGSTATAQAVSAAGHFHPYGWSADGSELVAVRTTTNSGSRSNDVVRWALAKPDVVQPIVATPADEGFNGTAISPDGRWLAYASDQTGRQEIWVRPFPGPGAAERISPSGGVEPVWARSGRELYYLEEAQLMAVAVTSGDKFNFSPPKRLFSYNYLRSTQPPSYDVAPDGRFLMLKSVAGTATASAPLQIVVVQNWDQELKRLVPTK